ncbi:hypothetical protein BH10BAC2_BH10BAC2_49040 [soil metagenome]
MKLIIVILVFSVAFTWVHSYAQQPVLSVQSFEYIKDDNPDAGKHWLSIPEAGHIKDSIKKSISAAIYQRWNIAMPEIQLSIKPLSLFSFEPKFNTKLKDKQPGTWYMFFQAFSRNNPASSFYDNSDNLTAMLHLKCRIINGTNDSLILGRDLTVKLYTETPPPGQVVLTKLPAHPASFAKAFDSIAAWLFQPEGADIKSVKLKPACVFSESGFNNEPLAQLEFISDYKSIQLVSQPSFSFITPGPDYRVTRNKKNIGGNTATGVLSLFTGVNFNKEKIKEYSADFPFETGADTFHCIINYAEAEIADRERIKEGGTDGYEYYHLESGEYSFANRRTDSSFINAVKHGDDTIATFKLAYLPKNQRSLYKQLWDGVDNSTIIPLPKEWNNNREDYNVLLKGTIGEDSFTMQSANERNIKNFFVNGQHALTVYGRKLPGKALLFKQLSQEQLKLFTILSSLPYGYFNYP